MGIFDHLFAVKGQKIDIEPLKPNISQKDFDDLVSHMKQWKKKYLVDNGSRTSERQKAILDLILRTPTQDLYKLVSHRGSCAFCAPRQGRVYSRSGKDPVFPPLALAFHKIDPDGPDVLWNTHLIPHPNCLCSLVAWTSAGRTPEELEEIRRFSNLKTNPLTHDPQTPEEIQAYKQKQKYRKKLLRDIRLFQNCVACGIDKFPKTFPTFEKHKQTNSEKYQEWMRQYGKLKPKLAELKKAQ